LFFYTGLARGLTEDAIFIQAKKDLLLLMAGKILYTVYKGAVSVKGKSGDWRRKAS